MAFNSNPGRAEYTATAAQTVFPFVFKIFLDSDIKVYLTPVGTTPDDAVDILLLTTDYTVSIDGDNGGEITLVSGATLNDSITIVRVLDINRLIEYQNNGDLLADTLNQDQNYQTYLIADKDAENDTHMKLPTSVQGVSVDLPAPFSDAYIKWNAAADALENDTTIPDAVVDAEAAAAAAAISETNAAASETAAGLSEDAAAISASEAAASAASIDPDSLVDINTTLVTDADVLTKDSHYRTDDTWTGSVIGGISGANQGLLIHQNWSTIYATQTFRPMQSNKTYTRYKDTGVWSAWTELVNNSLAQTIAGIKTFSSFGITPSAAPTTDYQWANKKYVDDHTTIGVLTTDDFLHIQDQKANGTAGGSSISGTQIRVLNTILTNTITGASLLTNQITLPAGDYYIEALAPATSANNTKSYIYSITGSANLAEGLNYYGNNTYVGYVFASVSKSITLAVETVIELRQYTLVAIATNGLGRPFSIGQAEIYSDIKIWKVG